MTLALPCSTDAEKFVLGSCLLDVELLHAARPVLTDDDFSTESHRRIWQCVARLYDGGQTADRVTVATALQDAGQLDGIGGLTYLVSLDDGLPQLPDISAYVKILRDDSTRRRIIALGDNLIHRAVARDNPQAILDSLAAQALDMAPADSGDGLVSARELVDSIGLDTMLQPRVKNGIPFPWPWMTRHTCGLLPGELWVLAGHTSTGKTSAALQLATHAAARGTGTAIFSLEMAKPSLFTRAVWQMSGVDSERAKQGELTDAEKRTARESAGQLYEMPIFFDDSSTSMMAIHASVRRRKLKAPVGLIVIDYLQLLGDGGRHDNRAQAVGANARAAKLMASEFRCPVVLLSQFSRESAKPGKLRRPELTDLKESGDIENHANGVWFVHRESQQDAETIPVEFILPKQRDGRRNIFTSMTFRPSVQRFEEVEA